MKNQFTSFEATFLNKLSTIDVASISKDDRVANYLQYLLKHKKYFLKIYSFVLANAVKCTNKNVDELSIVDFGTGNGLLAMYAKHCGFKHVYACDNYTNFIEAAKTLSRLINLEVDEWVVCNEYDLVNKFSQKNIDVIVGTDVIEHIYDLNIFFSNIHALNSNIITSFTTGSVHDNYFKRKKLEKLMKIDELEYIEIRKNIIQNYDASLNKNQLEVLSKSTRGLKEDDIICYVKEYKKSGKLKLLEFGKYNTCDPITGNFTERILSINEYKILYNKNNFDFETISGFYNENNNIFKSIFLKCLNIFIHIFSQHYFGRIFTSFILLIGKPKNY